MGRHAGYHTSKIDLSEVIRMKELGLSHSIIGARLGVTAGAIYHILKRENLYKSLGVNKNPQYGRYEIKNPIWIYFIHKYKQNFGNEQPEERIMMLDKQAD